MTGTLDEMAHGIVTVLHFSPNPEPLVVELRGHTHEQAIYLAQAVADECAASGSPLAGIQIGEVHQFQPGGQQRRFEGGSVSLVSDGAVGSALWFNR